jgi:hypothetical protein
MLTSARSVSFSTSSKGFFGSYDAVRMLEKNLVHFVSAEMNETVLLSNPENISSKSRSPNLEPAT